jgi:serine/threonine protein phosphatase PrpC
VSAAPSLRAFGDTHVGKVRPSNEDSLIVEPHLGLYAVLDGMGGASAGDVASQLARDTVRDFILHRRMTLAPRELLEAAIAAGSQAVFLAAQRRQDRHGMGTTVVACLVVEPDRVVVGNVGDSRAYLLRGGRLQSLTRDHTVVQELLHRGVLSVEEAERHPYKNVLSRNLGGKPETQVDLVELELRPGDRLLLCSDGLHGYASAEAIQYLLGSGDAPEHVAHDLIELALRGGGGDNVSAIVIEAPAEALSSGEVVRTTGASTWWQHRQRFLQVASDRGLPRNPIVRGLPAREALELVGLSLCQAIYHDLEKSTGVNVWTFAQNLASGWFQRGGDWQAVRGLIDILGAAAHAVLDDIRAADPRLGFLLDVAVNRALVVVELALGGLLGERLRRIDADLIHLHGEALDTVEFATREAIQIPDRASRTSERFIDRPTIPFLRLDRPITGSGVSAEVLTAIGNTITIARGQLSPRAEPIERREREALERRSREKQDDRREREALERRSREKQDDRREREALEQILAALETVAIDSAGNFAAAVLAAREIYGIRSMDEAGVMPLFDALDEARVLVTASVHQLRGSQALRVRVLRALSTAHQRLVGATTGLVLEAVGPFSERLREVQTVTTELRDAVAKAERKRADLERRFATIVDLNLPWGTRGSTEW